MALYVTRPRRDEVRIGRGLPSDTEGDKPKVKFFVKRQYGKLNKSKVNDRSEK